MFSAQKSERNDLFMKKISRYLISLMILSLVFISLGCTNEGNTNDNNSVSGTKSMVVQSITSRSQVSGTTSYFVSAEGCSNSDLSSLDSVWFTTPDGTNYQMGLMTGYILASHYYYGTSGKDHGELRDPFSESAQRQFGTGALEVSEPLNGEYRGKIGGDTDKKFDYSQKTYLDVISESDVSTKTGNGIVNVTSGDTITIRNQDKSGYKYFCIIYNNFVTENQCENIWASADISTIDWVNVNDTEDFYLGSTKSPTNGTVSFDIPGGVLTPEQEMVIMVFAVNTSTVNTDTGGDFRTLVAAQSRLRLVLQAQ